MKSALTFLPTTPPSTNALGLDPFRIMDKHRGQPGFTWGHIAEGGGVTALWLDGIHSTAFQSLIKICGTEIRDAAARAIVQTNYKTESLLFVTHETEDGIAYGGYIYDHQDIREILGQPLPKTKRAKSKGFA